MSKQIELLMKHSHLCGNVTIGVILNSLMKFINSDINLRGSAIPIFEQYLESWDPELQLRASEYIILSQVDGENENIPNMNEVR